MSYVYGQAGGAVKFFPPGKYWKRTILKYSEIFCILYIEKMKRGNKVESTYKKKKKNKSCKFASSKKFLYNIYRK